VAGGRGRGKLRFLVVVVCFLGALVVPGVAAAAGPTIVSLTFDDGSSDQNAASPILAQHAMHGTFYINSGNIDSSSSFMTWSQLSGLAADGNEIGGHTINHVDLTTVDSAEATHQVCDDRQALISHGFNVTDFAYPFGSYNSSVEAIVQGCGYSSARRSWGLCLIGESPPNCNVYYPDVAERIPPVDRYATRTIQSIRAWNTLADIESVVTRAENNGGGWVTLVFHHICDGCDPDGYSVSPDILNSFLDWLQPRASNSGYDGSFVRTVRDVVSDTTPPTSSISCNGASCSSSYGSPVTVSLSATDAGTAVSAIRYTTDGSTPTTSSPLYTGPFTVSTTTTVKYRAWDVAGNAEATKSQPIQVDTTAVDTTAPSSSIACNSSACSSGWYAPPVSISLSATDTGSGVAAIRYTTDGSTPTSSSPLYTSPFSVSATTTINYRAWDVAGNVEATRTQVVQVDGVAPGVNITSPVNGSTVTANVKVVASSSDSQSGVASVAFYVDGSTLIGTATSAPWQLPWNTKKVSRGQHVLTAVATDRAGNRQTSAPITVTVR
jgi:Polysaccharide deacetylase/Bacterial Ig domain/Chitobiase/beta-hexosaminidase C-terminal domain